MEIHTPDRLPETWKETAKHLAIITAGVLIALALEGVVAWADHRLLVREAKANLTSEIQANKKELDGSFASLEKLQKQLEQADDIAQLAAKGTMPKEISFNSNAAELKNAAVTTGQITGAFGYMAYGEVRRYADVYDLQAQYMRLQEREGEKFQAVFGFARRFADSTLPSAAALEEWRREISSLSASLFVREQMARQLSQRYDELLR